MAVIPVGFAQVNMRMSGPALPFGAEWTFGVDVSAALGGPSGAATDIIANYGATIDPEMPPEVTLQSVLVKFGPNATGPAAEITASDEGSGSGTVSPPNVAWLVRKVTALGGRAGRGRMFVPGLTEGSVNSDGTIVGPSLSAWQAAFDSFYDELVTSGLPPVLLHSEGSPLTTPTPISAFIVDSRAATQRRRLRR